MMILEMCKIRFWQFRDCGGHIFPRKNANFGRFQVAFDRPDFHRTQQCLFAMKLFQNGRRLVCRRSFLCKIFNIVTVLYHGYYFTVNLKYLLNVCMHRLCSQI